MPTENLETVLAMPESRGLSVDIAARLRSAILNGHFGPGERLREEALASAMGVSRGPIREALTQLEREGLIVIRRNRGAFVARLSRSDLEEVYTVRVAIERLAMERATNLHDESDVAEMRAVIDTSARYLARGISEQESAELDVQFHDRIYRAARHRRLYEFWTNLRPQIHILLLSRNVAHHDFREQLVPSHEILLAAIRSGNVPRAAAAIEDHLRGSYERALRGYPEESAGEDENSRTNGRSGLSA